MRRAGHDLEQYRLGYPGKVDNPALTDNLRFHQGKLACRPEGLTIDELHRAWAGDYATLEECHSFVQWLFPIQEQGVNSLAHPLQRHERDAIRADPAAMRRCHRSYALMLDFYGFKYDDEATGAVSRRPAGEFEPRFRNLLNRRHNFLRVTRMLKWLGEMGLEGHKLRWLAALEQEVYGTRALDGCREAFEVYWVGTVVDDATRAAIERRCRAAPAGGDADDGGCCC